MIPVAASETGMVRVFALDLPQAEARALLPAARGAEGEARLRALLGAPHADLRHVDVIETADLIDGGLPWYLTDGAGAEEAAVSADAARLREVAFAVIVLSAAVAGRDPGLDPGQGLRLVGAYPLARPAADPLPLGSRGAEGGLAAGPGKGSDSPLPRWLTFGLLALAGLVALVLALTAMLAV